MATKLPVLFTRAKEDLSLRLAEFASVDSGTSFTSFYIPLMEISLCEISDVLAKRLVNKDEKIWIAFTSKNAVRSILKAHESIHPIAVIGHATENELKNLGHNSSFIPSEATAETFSEEFSSHLKVEDFVGEVIFFHGSTAPLYFSDYLLRAGFKCERVLSYNVNQRNLSEEDIRSFVSFIKIFEERLASNCHKRGALVFYSALQVDFFLEALRDVIRQKGFDSDLEGLILTEADVVTIGPKTAMKIKESGFARCAVAENHSESSIHKILGGM